MGRKNQYKQLVKAMYFKLMANGKKTSFPTLRLSWDSTPVMYMQCLKYNKHLNYTHYLKFFMRLGYGFDKSF